MSAEEFYRKKFTEWQIKGDGNYSSYIRKLKKEGIKNELQQDPTFEREVCTFIRNYAGQQEEDALYSILRNILGFPEADVLNIVVAATLELCFPENPQVNNLIGSIVGGVVIAVVVVGLLSLIFNRK
ncbi:MAG: DUF732 domain-containing protein [Candidatus Micrarchaeaceae archaeon]